MKWTGRTSLAVIGCLAVVITAHAVTDNPYQKIVERNIFGLKPPPPPPPPPTPPPPPVPKITLQGITTILGRPQVLFKAVTPPMAGKGASDHSYILTVGQRDDDIEVLAIDQDAGTVKFNNHGIEQSMDMKTDAAKASPGTAQPVTKAPLPVPVFNAGNAAPGGEDNTGLRHIPQRNVRTTPDEEAGDAGQGQSPQAASPAAAPAAAEEPTPSLDEQAILIEVNRERNKEAVARGDEPPLPPTDLTPPDAVGIGTPVPQSTPQE